MLYLVQIGKGNVQNVSNFEKLKVAIDQAEGTPAEKVEAKSLIDKISENKLILAAIVALGAAFGR